MFQKGRKGTGREVESHLVQRPSMRQGIQDKEGYGCKLPMVPISFQRPGSWSMPTNFSCAIIQEIFHLAFASETEVFFQDFAIVNLAPRSIKKQISEYIWKDSRPCD